MEYKPGVGIKEVGGVYVVVINDVIVNPFSKDFKYYLANIDSTSFFEQVHEFYETHSKDHYYLQVVKGIAPTEKLSGVKACKLNVCKICNNYCSKSLINKHLKTHGKLRMFSQYTFITSGYTIPNLKKGMSYIYRKRENLKEINMMESEAHPIYDRSGDQFLKYIIAEDYYGKDYHKYLYLKDVTTSSRVQEAIKRYVCKKRAHLKSSHPIFGKLTKMNILKTKFESPTEMHYASLAGRFFYTFSMYSENPLMMRVVTEPLDKNIAEGMYELMSKYVLVEEDKTEKFLKSVIISIMLNNDRFLTSPLRAKYFDGINYLLKIGTADYMVRNDTSILLKWDNLMYSVFESYRQKHNRFNNGMSPYTVIPENEEKTRISIAGDTYSISGLSKLVRCLIEDYYSQISKILPKEIISIDSLFQEFKEIAHENYNMTTKNYSVFYSNERLCNISEASYNQYVEHQGEKWKDQKYMYKAYKALSDLNINILICLLITCGSPFRISEVLTLTFANPNELYRTMFYIHGMIQVNILYGKNTNSSMSYTDQVKYLPWEVTRIIIHYIQIVRYIEVGIISEHGIPGGDRVAEPRLFPNTVNGFSFCEEEEEEEEEIEIEIPGDRVSYNKSERLAQLKSRLFMGINGPREGAIISKYLEKYSVLYANERYTPRLLRQSLTFFTRIHLANGREIALNRLNMIDKLAGHSTGTADRNYGVTHHNNKLPSEAKNNLEMQLSIGWHEILNFFGMPRVEEEIVIGNIREFLKLVGNPYTSWKEIEDVGKMLYKTFDKNEQSIAILDAANSVDDVILVSPTGSGKSNMFKIPVLVEKRKKLPFITIVICPFISLLEDLKVKMKEIGVIAEVFSLETPLEHYTDCEVIILQLEKVELAKELFKYFSLQSVRKFIRRVVLDEAHVYIHHVEFRVRIKNIPGILKDIPKVFLSATMGKETEYNLRNIFGNNCLVHRERTVKTNVEHVILNVLSQETAIREIYLEEVKPKNTKAIVFLHNKKEAKALSKSLESLVFHGDMTPNEKGEVYEQFSRAGEQLIVATSAFSHGVDVREVSHVITIGSIKNVIDFLQVVGRMWRAEPNRIGKSYIMLNEPNLVEVGDRLKCINGILSRILDNQPGTCETLGCVRCSNCDPAKERYVRGMIRGEKIKQDITADDGDPWFMIRYHKYNFLKYCGVKCEPNQSIIKILGCPSRTFFQSLISLGGMRYFGNCRGCLFSEEHALLIDKTHRIGKECSLRGVMEVNIMLILAENDGMDKFSEYMTNFKLSYDMLQRSQDILENKERYRRELLRIINVPKPEIHFSALTETSVIRCLLNENISSHDLVYLNGERTDLRQIYNIKKQSKDIFLEINGAERGTCLRCWCNITHQLGEKCPEGKVLEILIYSYFERELLKEFLKDIDIASVCHLITLMLRSNPGKMFYTYIRFLLDRFERSKNYRGR